MKERANAVTMKGSPLSLMGNELRPGDTAPDVSLTKQDMSSVKISDYKGKVLIISAVPSLDTPVCDTETRKFNEKAVALGDSVKLLTVSMDLPFAQARWCGAAGIKNIDVVSDYQTRTFGENYGILIKGLNLLARCLFIVDKTGKVQYVQLVKEVAQEPDYDSVLKAAKELGGK